MHKAINGTEEGENDFVFGTIGSPNDPSKGNCTLCGPFFIKRGRAGSKVHLALAKPEDMWSFRIEMYH